MKRRQRPAATVAVIACVAMICGCGSSAPTDTAGSIDAHAQQALRFAQCMRSNGVSGFPDPGPSGRFTIEVANGSSLNPRAPAFEQAMSACKSLEPEGFVGNRRSPAQQAASLEFAKCVRRNGVPDFPDPTPADPLVDTGRISSAQAPGGRSVLRAAMQKCSSAAAAAGVTQ